MSICRCLKKFDQETGLLEEAMSSRDRHGYPETAFVVYIGGRKFELPPQKFLEVCWKGGFDTPCSVCNSEFDVGRASPVRTLRLHHSLHTNGLTKMALPPVVILNTHLGCLKRSRVKYFPISHTWHQPVADAYASRVSSPAAASMVFEITLRILLAVAQRFGPDVHIWHDYMSIPQWQDSFRGTTILPQIFRIFKHGYCSIIHLDEQPAIQTLKRYTQEDFITESKNLQRLFKARWFTRMWPVVEYHVCRDAYLINSNYELMPDTLPSLVKQIADYHVGCSKDSGVPSISVKAVSLEWFQDLPIFIKERTENKCLGLVYDTIANQGCRSHRDRFIASCALLDIENHSQIPWELPQDPREACLWVSKRCLEGNDFSPLLLCPSQEPQYDGARWLKGHTIINSSMWGLSFQTQPAHTPPRLNGNRVHLELDFLGTLRQQFSWKTDGASNHYGFLEVLPLLADLAGGSASRFLGFMERIYPSRFFWVEEEDGRKFPSRRYRVPSLDDIEIELRFLLNQYSAANYRTDAMICRSLCQKIISVLALEEPPSSVNQSYGDIGRLQLCAVLCASTEYTLVLVECETCRMLTPFRASLWRQQKDRARLYRIPGLSFMNSIPEGMGMIVEDGEIIGRMCYGLPACHCNPRYLVQLS